MPIKSSNVLFFLLSITLVADEEFTSSNNYNNESNYQENFAHAPISSDIKDNINSIYTVNTPYSSNTIVNTVNMPMYNAKSEMYPIEDDFTNQVTEVTNYEDKMENFSQSDDGVLQNDTSIINNPVETTITVNNQENNFENFQEEEILSPQDTPIENPSLLTSYEEEKENFKNEETLPIEDHAQEYLSNDEDTRGRIENELMILESNQIEDTRSVNLTSNQPESVKEVELKNETLPEIPNKEETHAEEILAINKRIEEYSSKAPSLRRTTPTPPPAKLTPLPYASAISKARRENKIILLEVVSTNCKYCEKMQDEVFSEQIVIDTINKDFVYMRMNGQKETLPLGIGLMGSPMHIFINKNEEKEIHRGFKSKDEFLSLLRKINS